MEKKLMFFKNNLTIDINSSEDLVYLLEVLDYWCKQSDSNILEIIDSILSKQPMWPVYEDIVYCFLWYIFRYFNKDCINTIEDINKCYWIKNNDLWFYWKVYCIRDLLIKSSYVYTNNSLSTAFSDHETRSKLVNIFRGLIIEYNNHINYLLISSNVNTKIGNYQKLNIKII
jgi:hypothetical protein